MAEAGLKQSCVSAQRSPRVVREFTWRLRDVGLYLSSVSPGILGALLMAPKVSFQASGMGD